MLFSELAKRVAEKYPEVKTAYPMDCELSNVELYDPSGAVPPVDSLSIYTARQIGQDMTLPLCFVCAGTPDQAAHDKIAYSDSNYIIIPQVSVVDVVYYIMSLFGDSFKQQKLYSNLIYMLLNGADLTSVFCEFSKGTGSQLLAIDISGKVLAYSKPFRVNHPHWIHSIEVGYLDNYLIEYILSYRVKHKMDMSPNTFVLFCNRLQMYIKVIRVIADNEIIGYVFMGNYTGEFPWFSDKLMHLLAKNLHSTLLGSRSYSTYRFNMHQSMLSDIIDGASEEETIQRINAAKLTFPPNMRAVVLKPSYFRGNEYLYDVLMPRVAEILPASPRVYKKNAIVTFVGVDNAGALPEETRTAIETLAADGQVLVGVSNLFHKPSKLYVYYQQALQAMSFSRRLSNTGGVFFFSDYAFYIMLDRMEDKPLLEQCRHPVLASLEAYDAGKNTELYETLKIYTKTGFSKNHTAELMFMHRNTVNYRIQQIENLFWEKGYRNHNGRKIAHTTMSGMISNPKYKGYYVGNKVRIVDMFTKKQKFLPPEEWVMFKDESGEIVPAIVSEELWDAANAVLTRRSRDVKRRQNLCNHDNLLTGKLYCTHCGAAYYRRDAKDRKGSVNSKWVCSGKIKNGKDSCPSLPLYEQELRPVLMDVFKEADVNADELIERYIEMYRAISQDDTGLAQEIDTQRTRRELAEKKKSKLLEYNVTGQITDADFLKMNRQCDNEIDECNLCLEELEAARTSRADLNAHIAEIRRVLQTARDDAVNGLINRDFVQKYIDRIFVTVDNDKIQLQIKLFTSESTMRYLEKLERRSGHTFKKMIESYEQSLAAKG